MSGCIVEKCGRSLSHILGAGLDPVSHDSVLFLSEVFFFCFFLVPGSGSKILRLNLNLS